MTKGEATAIYEATCRALRAIEGADMPWVEMGGDLAKRVNEILKGATDEIKRVKAMADAELE